MNLLLFEILILFMVKIITKYLLFSFKNFNTIFCILKYSSMAGVLYKGLCRFGDKVSKNLIISIYPNNKIKFVYPILPGVAKQKWNHPAGPKTGLH